MKNMIKKEFIEGIKSLNDVDHNTPNPKEYGKKLRKQFIKVFGFRPERIFNV